MMRVHAVINRRAGSALGLDVEALTRALRASIRKPAHALTISLPEPEQFSAAVAAAAGAKPDVLLAGGGDGTVRAVARHLVGTDTALSIIPLGTVNRLARDLRFALDPLKAVMSFPSNRLRMIDAAEVNGEIFLCNSLFGLPPLVSEERQKLRGGSLPVRVRGYWHVLRTILSSRRRLEILIDDEVSTRRMRVMSFAVSNNLYRHDAALIFQRQQLDGGKLGVYIARHRTGLGVVWLLVRASLGLWSGDPSFDRFSAAHVTIRSARGHMRLSNDGEVETLSTPLVYRVRPLALKVFAPAIEGA